MTAPELDLVSAFHQVFGVPTYETRDTSPAAYLDEDTLRRSRHSLIATSTTYRRSADHPSESWMDDLGCALGQYREAS